MIDSEKVVSIFDDLRQSADTNIYRIVTPNTWSAYSNLRDVIDLAEEDILELLKEQEEKPLQCEKCSYHREDGWCSMHRRWVNETDYCSFGAWKGR